VAKVEIRRSCGFPSAVGKSRPWTFPRSVFFHSPPTHRFCYRAVFSFWENAASLVLNDVIHPGLFFTWNGEMVFVYAKFKPFLKELRKQMDNPTFMAGVEKAVSSSREMRKRVDVIQKRLAKMAEKAKAAKSR
jgi:hypothetical protein